MSHSMEWGDMEEEEEDHDDGSMSLMISSSSTTNSSLSLPPPPPPPPSSQGEGGRGVGEAIVGRGGVVVGLSSSSPCLLPSSSSSPSQPNFQYPPPPPSLPPPRRLEPSPAVIAPPVAASPPPPGVINSQARRKKWTEEEEDTLITKYRELLCSGVLAKLKTRARKFQPVADRVNALHHGCDPAAFPWEWTWRDVSIKVQNMRHQYVGVKQKIRRCFVSATAANPPPARDREDEYDWDEGVNHWPNFLKYKEVFGDVELLEPNPDSPSPFLPPRFSLPRGANPLSVSVGRPIILNNRPWGGGESKQSVARDGIATVMPNGGELGLAITAELGSGSTTPPPSMEPPTAPPTAPHSHGVPDAFCIDYDGIDEHDLAETGDEDAEKEGLPPHPYSKRRKLSRSSRGDCIFFNYLVNQFAEFRNRELQRQERERSKDREREERDSLRNEAESDMERQREALLRQAEQSRKRAEHEREKREEAREERARQFQHKLLEMWEEDRIWRRKLEERREKETMDWMERMARLEMEHQASIMQVHARLAQNQQTAINLLMALVLSLGVENPRGHVGFASPVVSQLLQNIQQSRDDIIQEVDKRSNAGGDNDSFLVNE